MSNKTADKKRSGFTEVWRRFQKNKMALVALCVFGLMLICAAAAPLIANYDTEAIAGNYDHRSQKPNADHWFGTDNFGRDIFARVVFGTRASLISGLTATILAMLLACIIGSIAAFYSGVVDNVIMRILDMFMGIPMLVLAIAISSSLGPGMPNLILAITIAQVPSFTRIVRSSILNIVGQEFIEAAKSYGAGDIYIILNHVLPNAIGTIIVQSTMSVASVILNTAALSYLGLGMQPPAPELGSMLSEAKEFMRYYPHMVIFPGLTIALLALSLNIIGDGLRDALDPRLKN